MAGEDQERDSAIVPTLPRGNETPDALASGPQPMVFNKNAEACRRCVPTREHGNEERTLGVVTFRRNGVSGLPSSALAALGGMELMAIRTRRKYGKTQGLNVGTRCSFRSTQNAFRANHVLLPPCQSLRLILTRPVVFGRWSDDSAQSPIWSILVLDDV
jgi:hypothetical protein